MTTISPTAPAIAFLGTGRMGAPMAANLTRGGFGVRVWNRTISRAEALTAEGAVVASSPAQAVRGAAIVITMLADGPPPSRPPPGRTACWPQIRARYGCRWPPSEPTGRPGSPRRPRKTAAPPSPSPASGHADDDLSAVYLTT